MVAKAEEVTALIEVKKLDVATVFTDKGMTMILEEIKVKAKDFTPDISTDSGRKEIASMAYKVARSKTLIDDLGKATAEEWKKKVDNINKYRKQARDFLDPLKEEVRKPLTDWEAEQENIRQEKVKAEEKRVANIRTAIDEIKTVFMKAAETKSSIEVQDLIDKLASHEITEEAYQEFRAEADTAKASAIARLTKYLEAHKEAEKQAAEQKAEAERLEKIRQEQAVSEEKTRKEREALEAERQKIEAAKKALEDAKKAEQDRKDREALERQLAEAARIKAEVEAKAGVEREAKEAKEKAQREAEEAARKEKLRPDKEKLIAYGDALMSVPEPELKDKKARQHLYQIVDGLQQLVNDLKNGAEAL